MNYSTVIWLTGLSGAGKSTIANAIVRKLDGRLTELVQIDGNVIRDIFGPSLGFDESARKEQIGRIQRLAKFLADQGQCVLVSALYSHLDLMRWNRNQLPNYFEILIDASLELVQKRDPRGLYAKAQAGQMPDIVGIDVPWHKPQAPDLIIDPSSGDSAETMADQIIAEVPSLKEAMK